MRQELILILIFFGLAIVSGDGITLTGVKCGVKSCKLAEFCSSFDKTCQPCSDICNPSNHNYELQLCEKDCQDYLHDLRYARKTSSGSTDDGNLRETVDRLSRMLTVTLTLVCLMLIVLAGVLCFQLYRWAIKKNITIASLRHKVFNKGPQPTPPTKANNGTNPGIKKSELRLEMPSTGSVSDHSPGTVTTSISRRPAEDSTLDYAYDNPAMSTPR